jgi:hypothetical protein
VKRFVPLIRSNSLFTRFFMEISSPGFVCKPQEIKLLMSQDFDFEDNVGDCFLLLTAQSSDCVSLKDAHGVQTFP